MISAEAGGEGTQKPDENSECDSDNGEEPYQGINWLGQNWLCMWWKGASVI